MGDSMGGCSVGRISNTGMDLTIKSRYGIRPVEIAVGSAVVLLLGCTTVPQTPYVSSAEVLLGKSKQDVLACAGSPLREIPTARGNVLTYYKEASQFEESFPGSKSSVARAHHGCWAILRLENEVVTGVEYRSVPKDRLDYDHCDEIFENCAQ